MLIRHADPTRDAAACASVYAPFVTDGVASLEERAPGAPEMTARIETISARHPWLVAEIQDGVVGFAYATEHRARAAYRWATPSTSPPPTTAAASVGRCTARCCRCSRARGYTWACAGITLPNQASVALHERRRPSPTFRRG